MANFSRTAPRTTNAATVALSAKPPLTPSTPSNLKQARDATSPTLAMPRCSSSRRRTRPTPGVFGTWAVGWEEVCEAPSSQWPPLPPEDEMESSFRFFLITWLRLFSIFSASFFAKLNACSISSRLSMGKLASAGTLLVLP